MFTDNQFMAQTASGLYGFLISNSLRFNDGSSDALNRTPGSAGNRKTMTWSGWVKRSELSGTPRFFGAGDDNYLSFAENGLSITLDIPIKNNFFEIYQEFEEIISEKDVKIYLAKDSFMSENFFKNSYNKISLFKEIKKTVDPDSKLESIQSKRLGL